MYFARGLVRITNYELQITNYELRITNYELRITNYELRIEPTIPFFWFYNRFLMQNNIDLQQKTDRLGHRIPLLLKM